MTNPVTTSRPPRQTEEPNVFFPTPTPARVTSSNPFLPPVTTAPTTPRPVTRPSTNAPTSSAPEIDSRASYCRGPDQREGNCVPIKDCQPLIDELQIKQTDAAFANFLRASNVVCGGTGTNVCCPRANGTPDTTSSKPLIKNSNEIPTRLPTEAEGCGYSDNGYRKIVGGQVSKKGAWPWIALIGYDDGLSASPFKCGGTLVTARHVVTAAHCLRRDL